MKSVFARTLQILLVAGLLAACGKAVPTETVPSATSVPTEKIKTTYPTLTLGPTPTATDTPLPQPSNTPKPTWTPTSPPKPSDLSYLGPIAYFANDYVHLINPDGAGVQTLFKHPDASNSIDFTGGFSWSPDGQSLAYSSSTWADIYIFSMKEAKATNITNMKDKFEMEPDWSPDGKQIVFTGNLLSEKFNIYVMNVDGSRIRKLTDCADGCRNPDWSPSGEYIAYEDKYDIYVMNADGSGARRVAHGGMSWYPTWSPDGQQIAFIRADGYETPRYLYLVNSDGTGAKALTDTSVNPRQFSWSPDGKYIVFDNFPLNGPIATLWILNVESGTLKQLAGSASYAPEWSPIMTAPVNPDDIKPLVDCTNGWTRLLAGGKARVMGDMGSSSNRVRLEPDTGGDVIAMLPPQTVMDVLEGPVCADGLVFWKVHNVLIPGGSGWTAEGNLTEYWLEPYEP